MLKKDYGDRDGFFHPFTFLRVGAVSRVCKRLGCFVEAGRRITAQYQDAALPICPQTLKKEL